MSENLEHNNLLARWLSKELTEEERNKLDQNQGLDDLKAVIDDIDTWQLPPVDIEGRLSEAKSRFAASEKKTIVRTLSFPTLIRVAATITLLAVAYFAITRALDPNSISIETGLAEQITHELPDGSLVTLGPQSKLEYEKRNWEEARNLDLVGQGFFDVEKGSTFKVSSILGEVTVLGTEFDMNNVGNKLSVNCFEGKVRVSVEGQSEILNALEGIDFLNGLFNKKALSGPKPSWISGISEFSNAPLSQVVEELQRYFSIKITLPSEKENIEYSGSFIHSDINIALRSIFTPLEISYTLSAGGKVVFD